MKTKTIRIATCFLGVHGLLHAAGTTAGTTISNQASLGYTVGGVAQTSLNSNNYQFVVDEKVIFTMVKADSAYVSVVPGQTAVVLSYTLTNSSNAIVDYRLSAANQTIGATDAFAGTTTFQTASNATFAHSSGTGTYNAGTDTKTFVDQLAADTAISVYVVSSISLTQVNNDIAGVNLTAIAASAATPGTLGSDLVNTSGADTPGSIDIVFADGTGTGGDSALDGKISSIDAFKVVSATITVTKTSTVLSDPINLTTNPKRIPGSTIQYTITAQNTGSAAATAVNVSDVVPTNTTYVASSIVVDGVAQADNGSTGDGSYTSGTHTVAGLFPTIGTSTTKIMTFKVTVN